MKYPANFERDFRFYLRMRHKFSFDGVGEYLNKKGKSIIQYSPNGVSGKEAFYKYDTNGQIIPTRHPNLLHCLLKTKGSTNLHIKMFALDRFYGRFPLIELRAFCLKYKTPNWFREAVENQKSKLYETNSSGV